MLPAVAEDDTGNPPQRFAADPLTSQDLTLPHSGWRKIGIYDELDGTATVQGNAWSHCSQANVVPLQPTQMDPTPAGADPLQQTENYVTVTGTTGSSCKLHITRSGRLFAFATRVSDDADAGGDSVPLQGQADNNMGGLQVPSDVTWADFQLKNPDISYEMRATTCGTTGDLTYCSPEIDTDGRVLSTLVETGHLYACAGSRVQTFPPLMATQSASNGVIVCDQDRDTRIHYTSAQDTIAPAPNSVCEADMEAIAYDEAPDSYICPGQTGIPQGDRTRVWKGSIDNSALENRVTTLRALAGQTRFFHLKAKAVKKFAEDSRTLSMTFTSATSLCSPSQLNCGVTARLARTSGGVTSVITMDQVTEIGAVAGNFPSEIPGMQSSYLDNIRAASGSGWETRTLEYMHDNAYNEAICADDNCEAGVAVPPIADLNPTSNARTSYDAFVVDMDLPKAASGIGMVPIMQIHVRWPITSRSEPPKGCSAFAITARQYTGRAAATDPPGSVGTDYTALKVKGGQLSTCRPAACTDVEVSSGTCTSACTDTEAVSSLNLYDSLDCATNGCDLEAHGSQLVDPYRSGKDVFLMYGSPIVDGLRYTCQKNDGFQSSDFGNSPYTYSSQMFQMGSWEIFGIKTPRSDYVVDSTCAPGEMRDCNNACRSALTLGDGVCDAGFNCQSMVYDEMDCLSNCEETTKDGVTCSELVTKGVSKKMAEAGGWDCSCTGGP